MPVLQDYDEQFLNLADELLRPERGSDDSLLLKSDPSFTKLVKQMLALNGFGLPQKNGTSESASRRSERLILLKKALNLLPGVTLEGRWKSIARRYQLEGNSQPDWTFDEHHWDNPQYKELSLQGLILRDEQFNPWELTNEGLSCICNGRNPFQTATTGQ